jgi:LysM repeat protein
MQKFANLLSIILSVLFVLPLTAQSGESYLLFDAACMQKYDYEKSAEFHDLAFWDFHLKVEGQKTLIFRVLKQDAYLDEIAALDKEPLRCNDIKFTNSDFVVELNQNQKTLSIAEYNREKKAYTLYSVKKVITVDQKGDKVNIYGDYVLNLSLVPKIGDNIDSSGGRLLYLGDTALHCFKQYYFRAYDKAQPRFFDDLYYSPAVGLIKISKEQGSLNLSYINGVSLETYLLNNCNKKPIPKTLDTSSIKNYPLDSAGFYTIVSADNLYRIAEHFNTRVDVLMGLNNLKSDDLKLGQKIKVKDDGSYKDINPILRKDEKGLTYKIHLVRQGEILVDIAAKYKTTVEKIIQLNDLKDTKIEIFQELIVEIIKPN